MPNFSFSSLCSDPAAPEELHKSLSGDEDIRISRLAREVSVARNEKGHDPKATPRDIKVPVVLSIQEISDIRRHTFLGPALLRTGIVEANGSPGLVWSLDYIEEVQGHVAASADHSKDRKLEKRLDCAR